MKRIRQRVAFFGILGCLTLMTLASRNNFSFTSEQGGKGPSNGNTEDKESLEELQAADNGYELSWRGKIFNYFID